MGVVHGKGKSAKSDKTQPNDCKGRLYSLSEELSRSFQLPVKSLVRRENARCSCPREEHSECLHQHLIPKRLYGVFDSLVPASQMPDRKFKRYACANVLPQCHGYMCLLLLENRGD